MNYLKLKQDVQAGRVAPVYFMYGTELFLMEDLIQDILSVTLSDEERDMNVSSYSLTDVPIETALEEAETVPFFGSKRVVILKDAALFTSQKLDVEHDVKRLEQYILNPVPETVLLIMAPYEKLDERKKITKLIKKESIVLEAKPLDEGEAKAWLSSLASELQVEVDEKAIDTLLGMTGLRLTQLASEMNKLALYVGEGGIIRSEDVTLLVAKTLDQNIFDLIDFAINQRTHQALSLYHELLKQKEEPLKLLALLTRQFRIMYQVKELGRRGYTPNQMAKPLKIHPYVAKLAGKKAASMSDQLLYSLIEKAADTEFAIKSGKVDKVLALELFLLTMGSRESVG